MSDNNSKRAGLGMDEFLDHETRGGAFGDKLAGWKKDGTVTIWLAKSAGVIAYPQWSHNWPRLVETEVKDTGDKCVRCFGDKFVCHESEERVLTAQYKRDEDGKRKRPPEVCPFCCLVEFVYGKIEDGDLDITEPLFEFKADDEDDSRIIHAGGLTNHFGKKDLSQDELRAMRRANVDRRLAWRENGWSRLQYLFQVVNDAKPGEGIKYTCESQILGERMKAAIRQRQRSAVKARKDPEIGNPLIHPYAFEWTYHEDKGFSDKYEVAALAEYEPSEEILDAIDGDLPDVSHEINPGNCRKLRAQMEEHALLDLPWDKIFGPAEKAGLMADDGGKSDGTDFDPEEIEGKKGRAHEVRGDAEASAASESTSGVECDVCDADLADDDTECGECGATYELFEDGTGRLSGRTCDEKDALVEIPKGTAENVICPKCAAIYKPTGPEESPYSTWERVESSKPTKAAAAARRGGSGKRSEMKVTGEKPGPERTEAFLDEKKQAARGSKGDKAAGKDGRKRLDW